MPDKFSVYFSTSASDFAPWQLLLYGITPGTQRQKTEFKFHYCLFFFF